MQTFLTILRNRSTTMAEFRRASDKLADLLAAETAKDLPKKTIEVQTPLALAKGVALSQNIILIPILRSGLCLLPAFLHIFEDAKVGFVGLSRDEKTKEPNQYYENLPPIGSNDVVIILDPMVATGGSALHALSLLEKRVDPANIILISVLAAPEGLKAIKQKFPTLKIKFVVEDEKLNNQKFILPGLGDYGDRYFGTTSLSEMS